MFSFNHITSISVSLSDYAKLSLDQQKLCEAKAKAEDGYWLRIGTTIELPSDGSEIEEVCDTMADLVECKFDKTTVKYPQWFAHAVTGWKLSINQSVQADYRSGSKTEQRAATLKWYCFESPARTMEYMQLAMNATTPALAKLRDGWIDALTEQRLAGKAAMDAK